MGSIGIFDSGIGGFTVLSSIKKHIKDQDIFYVADQKYVPYSKKSERLLKSRSELISKFLINKGCTTIVIACNTSTVFTISHLRNKHKNIKFVGVEPAIKPASEKNNGNILVLATTNTIKSKRLKELLNIHVKENEVFFQDMSDWVILAENNMHDSKNAFNYSKKVLDKYKKRNIATIVLACTHYPYYKKVLKKLFRSSKIIDPSNAIARQTKKIHNKSNTINPKTILYSTKSKQTLNKSLNLLPFKVNKVEYLSI